LNQQSEFTFYKLMLWLLQCLDGESSSGESPVPQIRSNCQFLLSRLFSSLNRSFLRSGFSWVSSLVWWLLHFWWMISEVKHLLPFPFPFSSSGLSFHNPRPINIVKIAVFLLLSRYWIAAITWYARS
jgi:hypothetical protein